MNLVSQVKLCFLVSQQKSLKLQDNNSSFKQSFKTDSRGYLMNRVTGREADCLWGPDLDLMVKAPPSLSNIQDLGAARRFRCFLGPRGILTFYF